MFNPLITLLVAKAKAVGLVAGTALVTTALVGGGAVAMTAVSSESDAVQESVVEQVEVVESAETVSATPTVGIQDPGDSEDGADSEEPKAPQPLPADFTCDPGKNHGQNVSAYARSLPKGPGRGEKVSAVAQSDCGKSADESVEVDAAEVEEAEEAKAPKPPKAEKPAKPAKPAKAAKPEKPAKAEGTGKPAGAGKPEGKGKS